MITLNESELGLIQGGDALDDYLNNPYLNPIGGYVPPYALPPVGYPPVPGWPPYY